MRRTCGLFMYAFLCLFVWVCVSGVFVGVSSIVCCAHRLGAVQGHVEWYRELLQHAQLKRASQHSVILHVQHAEAGREAESRLFFSVVRAQTAGAATQYALRPCHGRRRPGSNRSHKRWRGQKSIREPWRVLAQNVRALWSLVQHELEPERGAVTGAGRGEVQARATVQPEEVAGDSEAKASAAAALHLPEAHLRECLAQVEHSKLVGG
mmetsp:Transcript_24847/g.58566  ORF Transcript_24847/g.58566 Transcript_24847/m.58566 type:complete len:209 (-) Transcript_24847:209-835(-)